MRKTVGWLALGLVVAGWAAKAGPIDNACIRSNKKANPILCDCIQRVANLTLTASDQRLAARFFTDPGKAQEMRGSSRRAHREFWDRYVNFGRTAEAVCSRG